MTTERRKRIAARLLATAQTFSCSLSEDALEIYLRALERFEPDRVGRALFDISVESPSTKMPTVGQIVAAIRDQPQAPNQKLLNEPAPTEFELTYGQWQCRFAIWLMGKKKIAEKQVQTRCGYKTQSIYQDTKPRWKEAETRTGRQMLWGEFCRQVDVPEKIASVPMN